MVFAKIKTMSPKECIDLIASHTSYAYIRNDLFKFAPLIEEQNLKECLFIIIHDYHLHVREFFFTFLHFWNKLSYSEWLEIFHALVKDIKTHPSSFENLIFISYQYIGIDLIYEFSELTTIDDEVKILWLRDFAETPGRLFVADKEIKQLLDEYRQNESILSDMKTKFLKEGAKIATPIESLFHEGEVRGIKIFWVQGPVPSSWTWVQKFNLHLLDSDSE